MTPLGGLAGPLAPEQEAAAAQEAAAKARGITIAVTSEDAEAEVDARLVRRLLDELVANAVKFNRDGGRVSVSARRAPDGALVVEVADTGAGIAPADQARLFQPFGQLEDPLTRRHGGIGLALAQRIAALHRTRIEVASTPGEGSRFSVRL